MRIKPCTIALLIFCISTFPGKAQDIPPTTSLVYPGVDGKLVYVADSLGNKIPDFSNAGYKGGGAVIPYIPLKATLWPVPGDNTPAIQKPLTVLLLFLWIVMDFVAPYC
ncbi:MAG: hypothetical protein HC867_04385 [Bacteroidia bacterium]|nr:hypothetical protein [Bacteroidia bacterium]